jgi:hypothetical protein
MALNIEVVEIERIWDTSEAIISALRGSMSPGDAGAALMVALGRVLGSQSQSASSGVAYRELIEHTEVLFRLGFDGQRRTKDVPVREG